MIATKIPEHTTGEDLRYSVFFLLFQFCDVAKRGFSHIWLQTSYESKNLLKILLYPVYLLEFFCRNMAIFKKGIGIRQKICPK
jgi:hypothetical protein